MRRVPMSFEARARGACTESRPEGIDLMSDSVSSTRPMRWLARLGAAVLAAMGLNRAVAQSPPVATWSAESLAVLSPAQLEALYRQSPAGSLPQGWVRGTPLLRPGTAGAGVRSRVGRVFWQGKWFDSQSSTATNRFVGLPVISGRTGLGPSWLDGRPSLILDYNGTSRVYGPYRDEIRQVGPGVFLGLMYDRRIHPPRLVRMFVLEPR
jgi:hypothetical protein